ncbi:MAG: flagellar hook-associated protein FlgL [Ignavibacteria bacterium]|nr:MAG: flagellar hook-associated protein FlgL [Ignavibacteria bacterium]KAF0160153.1 MAG: flagellar hook-associated protein FlgL [Ignavibacteria bacterium]
MRVTEGLITTKYLNVHEKLSERKIKIQTQLASNSKIETLSDDIAGSLEAIRLDAQINRTKTYTKNAQSAQDFIDQSLKSLDQVTTELQNIMVAVTNSGNVINKDSFPSIVQSIKNSLSSIIQNVNSKHNDRYLFGGTNYSADPVTVDVNGKAVVSALDHSAEIKIQVTANVREAMNIPGNQVLNSGMFEAVNNVIDALASGNVPSEAQKLSLTNAYQKILDVQSLAGEKLNRLENIKNVLEGQTYNYTEMLARVQEIDPAELVMELQQQDYLLQVSSKLLANSFTRSVFDFI